jgi:glycine/D-amino acid oxidase-like deaminating enzyme
MPPEGSVAITSDVVVVGAGIVGAACAYAVAKAGLRVLVVDRGPLAGGTSSRGEGILLVSDKPGGPELALALLSLKEWSGVAAELSELNGQPGGGFEYAPKGALVVAGRESSLVALHELAAGQVRVGVEAERVPAEALCTYEPHLHPDQAGGVHYAQEHQVQPMLATARLLEEARRNGARVLTHAPVIEVLTDRRARVRGVRTPSTDVAAPVLVNAAGPWSGQVAALCGVPLPVEPRRGVILVTEPLPPLVRHDVYAFEYVANVASDNPGLEASPVVHGTPAGPILIGASRERVGFRAEMPLSVVRQLADQAVRLFPVLSDTRIIRSYVGFRPFSPDHLPIIGWDPRVEGLIHACGHEGAGISLAAITGKIVSQLIARTTPDIDISPFRPDRFW